MGAHHLKANAAFAIPTGASDFENLINDWLQINQTSCIIDKLLQQMDFGCGGRAEKGALVIWTRPIWFVGVGCPQIAFYPRLFIRHTNLHFG